MALYDFEDFTNDVWSTCKSYFVQRKNGAIWGLCLDLIHIIVCVSNMSNRYVKPAVVPLWLA